MPRYPAARDFSRPGRGGRGGGPGQSARQYDHGQSPYARGHQGQGGRGGYSQGYQGQGQGHSQGQSQGHSQGGGYQNAQHVQNDYGHGHGLGDHGHSQFDDARRGRGGPRRGPDTRSRIPAQERDAPSQQVRLERLARERVSRTLFIRNVAYEVSAAKLREQFEQCGEVKEFFDAIRRGMVFVTFFDVRAAEEARKVMMGQKIHGRVIDVHFSLPKDQDQAGPCDGTKNQGSIMATLSPRAMLEERELGEAAEISGAVKAIKSCGYQEKRIVEFYDSRAAGDFYDRMNGRNFMNGRLHLEYIWDVGEVVNHDVMTADAVHQATTQHRGSQTTGFNRSQDHGYGERERDRGDRTRGYDAPPPGAPSGPPQAGRLDQARKVQDLLASLGGSLQSSTPAPPPQPQYSPPPQQQYGAPPPAAAYPPYPPPASTYPPPASNYAPPPTSNYPPPPSSYPPPASNYPPPASTSSYPPYSPPASQYPPPHPPASSYPPPAGNNYGPPPSNYPPPNNYGQQSPPAPSSSLPPNVLAMLKQPTGQGYQPQHDGYDPANAKVGSLLNQLPR